MRTLRGRIWTTVAVVIIIGMVGVGVLDAIRGRDRDRSRGSSASNQVRTILIAMLVYANDQDGYWPVRPSAADGRRIERPGPDKFTTIGSFEFLAACSGMERHLFQCATWPDFGPRTPAALPTPDSPKDAAVVKDCSQWCIAAAADVHGNPGFVYDWSVPPNAQAQRVVVATRGRGTLAMNGAMHGVVVAAYGDGHVAILDQERHPTPPGATLNIDDSPLTAVIVPSSPGGDDDLFSPPIASGDMTTPGNGSATRAWLR